MSCNVHQLPAFSLVTGHLTYLHLATKDGIRALSCTSYVTLVYPYRNSILQMEFGRWEPEGSELSSGQAQDDISSWNSNSIQTLHQEQCTL